MKDVATASEATQRKIRTVLLIEDHETTRVTLAGVASVAVVWRGDEISTLVERWWPAPEAVAPPAEVGATPSAEGTEAPPEAMLRTDDVITVAADAPAADGDEVSAAGEARPVGGGMTSEPPVESELPVGNGPAAEGEAGQRAARREPAAQELTEVARISWEIRPGETVLVIVGNAPITEEVVRISRLDSDTPRQVIQLRGISRPYGTARLEVGSPEIERVRTGYHIDTERRELHLVADLANAGVRMVAAQFDGRILRVRFAVR